MDDFINQERQRYERVVSNTRRNSQRHSSSGGVSNHASPSILEDALSADDWDVLTIYVDILQPLDEVTKELQGRPGENKRNPAPIADVLIAYEYLLHHLEHVKEQYKTHPEQHIRWSMELG
ncbi:hypothetical protein LTS18_002287 [Coniosporium uncinatum]|uniref:Uncharacterized protein n=1 Tax=Coniosporium uncinatum TaxID=93489 RepID=A0ACC3DC27_9PEZI|nr:hypothetical protein LTS18_002287 [Coniosporium uncinatum]